MQEVWRTAAVSKKQTVPDNNTDPVYFVLTTPEVNIKYTPLLNSLPDMYFTALDSSGAATRIQFKMYVEATI